ncbi:MAG TPA: hypothetical protein VHD39_02390, partial [Acidimicrobiales bacterium]|nr:hypothetical protein [Acidimicrobiales bacterium]
SVLATLGQCGDPSSGFFDPLLNDIPTILDTLSGQGSSTTAQSMLQQGLTQIANATKGASAPAATPSTPAPNNSTPAPTTTTTTAPPTTTTTTPSCGLLGVLLGCSGSGSGTSSGSGSSSQGGSSSGGLGGLLAHGVTSGQQTATFADADADAGSSPAPTLTAPAAALLPPLPRSAHGARHHGSPGLLAGWMHDVAGWF